MLGKMLFGTTCFISGFALGLYDRRNKTLLGFIEREGSVKTQQR